METALNVRFSKPESISFLLIHIIEKLKVFTLSVFTMKVYVSGINERFNTDIVKTHNKNQYIYQSTYSIKDSVHTTLSSI